MWQQISNFIVLISEEEYDTLCFRSFSTLALNLYSRFDFHDDMHSVHIGCKADPVNFEKDNKLQRIFIIFSFRNKKKFHNPQYIKAHYIFTKIILAEVVVVFNALLIVRLW